MTSSNQTSPNRRPKPVVLCVLDGWGERDGGADNAIAAANTPVLDRMRRVYPRSTLEASELHVGLPTGQMGNSEVGHMNIGAGRIVMQELPRIDQAIKDGTIETLPPLTALIKDLAGPNNRGRVCHLMGLVSPGGVHSMQDHLVALVRVLDKAGLQTRLHAFLDGRDTPPSSALSYIGNVQTLLSDCKGFKIVTVTGRYFAMDRDKNWDRVVLAYNAMVEGVGNAAPDPLSAINNTYLAGKTDEFMLPAIIDGYAGMQDGDAFLMFNYRADRAREILTALVDPAFTGFARKRHIAFSHRVGMTDYSEALSKHLATLFPQRPLTNILGQVIAEAGLKQLRIAETEKYAHVTFFLNGGDEREFPGEERILVPSPKVATYDLKPEMSAIEVTDKLVEAIRSDKFDLIVVNYANGDMVGHTGIFEAAVKAAETVDACLGRLEAILLEKGGTLLITADHGNAEDMEDEEHHQPHTAHTLSLVPFIMVNPPAGVVRVGHGVLADVAPTILELMHIPAPAEMTGHSLINASALVAAK
jgi:2,3-bisphosphoglycerate-independent phosphoglycerate mutase